MSKINEKGFAMKKEDFTNAFIEETMQKVSKEILNYLNNKEHIVPHGKGLMFPMALEELRAEGIEVPYLIDDTPNLWGKKIGNVEIVPRDDKRLKDDRIIMGCTCKMDILRKTYEAEKRDVFSHGQYHLCKHYQEYVDVRDNYFEDNKSKLVYNIAMYALLTSYWASEEFRLVCEGEQYFGLPEFYFLGREHIVDVGAFVGDTLEKFVFHSLGSLAYYYGFEPGDIQYNALEKRKQRLCSEWAMNEEQIVLVKAGVSKENMTLYTGAKEKADLELISDSTLGGEAIQVVALDEYLKDKPVTLIKADIQGMEMDLIEGAKNIIKNQKPKLAICAYHLPSDLYLLPKRIREINPDYRFALRSHSNNYSEMVLYCY